MSTTLPTAKRFTRADLQPGDCLCNHCAAKCCQYFSLPIETPTEWRDFDFIRWFMIHGRVSIFVDGDSWYLMVHSACRHLLPDNRCGIYHDRPEICREYSTDNCEFDEDGCHDKFFETPEQIVEYAEALLPPRRRPAATTPEVPKSLLPILASVPLPAIS